MLKELDQSLNQPLSGLYYTFYPHLMHLRCHYLLLVELQNNLLGKVISYASNVVLIGLKHAAHGYLEFYVLSIEIQ